MDRASPLFAAQDGENTLLRIVGRGTLQESPTFLAFAMQSLDDPQASVVVDLIECEYLDSTFLGSLVALQKRFGRLEPPRFSVVADQPTQTRLLAMTGLNRVLNLCAKLAANPVIWEPIPICPPDCDDFRQHVMQCHRHLAEAGGPKSDIFLRIVDRMQQELQSRV